MTVDHPDRALREEDGEALRNMDMGAAVDGACGLVGAVRGLRCHVELQTTGAVMLMMSPASAVRTASRAVLTRRSYRTVSLISSMMIQPEATMRLLIEPRLAQVELFPSRRSCGSATDTL